MALGYVGLGNMGGALAARLQIQHPLLVHDRDQAAMRRLEEAGATPVPDVAELAGRCDTILLCLPTSDHVRSVLFGEGGLVDGLKPGTILIDQTTGDPTATRAMAEQLAERGVELVDAPVSGGAKGAQAGTIAIMVGASPEQFERIQPVLSAISGNIFHAGGVGNGQVIKLANNLLSGSQRLLTHEVVALATKNGVDPHTAVDILLASGGRNAYLEKFMGSQVLNGKLSPGFTIGLGHKDVRLACQLGSASSTPLFYGGLTLQLLQMYVNELGPDAQIDGAALVMDRLAGTSMVPDDHDLQ